MSWWWNSNSNAKRRQRREKDWSYDVCPKAGCGNLTYAFRKKSHCIQCGSLLASLSCAEEVKETAEAAPSEEQMELTLSNVGMLLAIRKDAESEESREGGHRRIVECFQILGELKWPDSAKEAAKAEGGPKPATQAEAWKFYSKANDELGRKRKVAREAATAKAQAKAALEKHIEETASLQKKLVEAAAADEKAKQEESEAVNKQAAAHAEYKAKCDKELAEEKESARQPEATEKQPAETAEDLETEIELEAMVDGDQSEEAKQMREQYVPLRERRKAANEAARVAKAQQEELRNSLAEVAKHFRGRKNPKEEEPKEQGDSKRCRTSEHTSVQANEGSSNSNAGGQQEGTEAAEAGGQAGAEAKSGDVEMENDDSEFQEVLDKAGKAAKNFLTRSAKMLVCLTLLLIRGMLEGMGTRRTTRAAEQKLKPKRKGNSMKETGVMRIWSGNITTWGHLAESYITCLDVECAGALEVHKCRPEAEDIRDRVRKRGWRSNLAEARVSGKSERGTQGGALLMARANLDVAWITEEEAKENQRSAFVGTDWVVGRIKLKGFEFLLVYVYLNCSAGVASENCAKLGQIMKLVKEVGLPFLALGDWNVTPAELIDSEWPRIMAAAVFVPGDEDSTCFSTTNRLLDYAVGSREMEQLILEVKRIEKYTGRRIWESRLLWRLGREQCLLAARGGPSH